MKTAIRKANKALEQEESSRSASVGGIEIERHGTFTEAVSGRFRDEVPT